MAMMCSAKAVGSLMAGVGEDDEVLVEVVPWLLTMLREE